MPSINKQLFDVIQEESCDYQKFIRLETVVSKIVRDECGKVDCYHYQKYSEIMDMINNAGWETKKDAILKSLRAATNLIEHRNSEYLP